MTDVISPGDAALDLHDPDSASSAASVQLAARAQEVARDAAVTESGGAVGDYLGAHAEDDVAVTALFASTDAGYLGWQWNVTLALVDADNPTVSEVVLLPGTGALLAPAWVPWDQRVRAGDLGVGDLMPPGPDDPRIVPAYLQSDDPAVEEVAREIGLGRVRVLSREGRIDAAERWHDGPFGPESEMAAHAPAHCATCAFYLPLAGSLGGLLGACGNEFAPADGRVVDAGYGCGAHSELVVEMPARSSAVASVVDELLMEVHTRPVVEVGPVDEVAADAAVVDAAVVDAAGWTRVVDAAVVDAAVVDAAVVDAAVADLAVPDSEIANADGPDVAEPLAGDADQR